MNTPDFLLTCNLSTGVVTAGTDAWLPPVITWGEGKSFALRFTQNQGATAIEPVLDIRATKASLGLLDERPASGQWKLQVGPGAQTVGNTSDAVQYDAAPADLAAAINARSAVVSAYGTATVTQEDGSWVIQFGAGAENVPLTVRDNTLQPISLGNINAYTVDDVWLHEVRLEQAALAFCDTAARVLPPPPVVTSVRPGSSGAGYTINQLSQLYVPPSFRGSYYLQTGTGLQTTGLSQADTIDTIQAALEAILGTGNVVVSNPDLYIAQIEMAGDLAGTDPALLIVVPFDPPVGDLTFTLPFNKGQLLRRLRKDKALTAPLEVRIYLGDALEERVVLSVSAIVKAPLIFPELSTVPEINWLRPASPKDYIPFSSTPVITGQQYFPAVVGNGSATVFPVDHGLATDVVLVWVFENISNGLELINGTDYRVRKTNTNTVTVTSLVGAPAAAAWLVVVASAQTVAAFADGLTVTTGQVTGLDALLTALGGRIATIEDLVPTTPLGTTSAGDTGSLVEFEIPDFEDAYPGVKRVDGKPALSPLPRPGGLLPAIHDASVTIVSSPPFPGVSVTAGTGNVYVNDTGVAAFLPGGMGTRGVLIPDGGVAASDGRRFYPVSAFGATTSFFPTDFERQLFMFEINAQMLRAGTTLTLGFKLALQMLAATSRMQALLVVEHGAVESQTSPATTAPNLQDILWNDTPLLSQRIIIGDDKLTGTYGIEVIRSGAGVLSANKVIYGFKTAAGSVPAAADFALRARLINFDTENSVSDARGILHFALSSAAASIA